MIDVVIVDDEELNIELIEYILNKVGGFNVLGKFTDPLLAMEEIESLSPDLAFLDIEMPGITGLELADKISTYNPDIEIVFVTAHQQYAIEAFQMNALSYILKPVNEKDIRTVLSRFGKLVKPPKLEEKSFYVNLFGAIRIENCTNGEIYRISTEKSEELFALLVMNRANGISKWQLVDYLWEEADIDKSEQYLYSTLFRLKKDLRSIGIQVEIKNSNGIYNMNLLHTIYDIDVFDRIIEKETKIKAHRAIKNISTEDLEKAVDLYKGVLFGNKAYSWSRIEENYYKKTYLIYANRLIKIYDHIHEEIKMAYLERNIQKNQ